jgi:TonB family protein
MKPFLLILPLMLSGLNFAQNQAPRGKAVSQIEVTALLATGSTSGRISKRVQDRGIDFTLEEALLRSLQDDGASDALLAAVKSAEVRRGETATTDAAGAAKDAAALAHLHRAAQLNRNNFHRREAEPEFREAVAADPDNPFVHLALGEILDRLDQRDESAVEFRTALKLLPESSDAHLYLGELLIHNPAQHREALEQLQQAVALAPSDEVAHNSYANALAVGGDKEGAAEQRKIADGLRGNPVPKRIRVGGQVMQAKLGSQARPHYPPEAKAAHVQGTVRLNVLIGRNGAVKDIEVVSGDSTLSEAAIKAVWKWRYQPTLLNGQPVEVVTEIDVNFNLK